MITHQDVATRADGPNDGRVQPSWWNKRLVADGVVGALDDLAATPNSIPSIGDDGSGASVALGSLGKLLVGAADVAAARAILNLAAAIYSTAQTDTLFAGKLGLSGGTMTGPITLSADPLQGNHAATKNYVDSLAAGLQTKPSVKAATTANVTRSGAQTVDGVALVAGDRVLVKNQTAPAENGIFVVASGSWTRATDIDAWSEVIGAAAFVSGGTVNAATTWVASVAAGGTIDTTAITFAQFGGQTAYTAGNALGLTGNVFSVTNATLVALATLTPAANKLAYLAGTTTAALTDLTAFGRTLIGSADAAAARASLGVAWENGATIGSGGTGAATFNLNVNGSSGAGGGAREFWSKNGVTKWQLGFHNSIIGSGYSDDYDFYSVTLGAVAFSVGATGGITAIGGQSCIGSQPVFNGSSLNVIANGALNAALDLINTETGASTQAIAIIRRASTNITGSITHTDTATSFNTTSDERLKDFIGKYDAAEAIRVIRADPVRSFVWRMNGKNDIGWGAQTSHAISPDLAHKGHGAPGDADYVPWGVDKSNRTPYLWAALSNALDRIDELERKLEALS